MGWTGITLPAESISLGFGELLKREMELAKPKQVAVIEGKLKPLSILLKCVLWHLVKREGRIAGRLVLRLFEAPNMSDMLASIKWDEQVHVNRVGYTLVRDLMATSLILQEY